MSNITHSLGGDAKPKGSLSEIITELTKGGICPNPGSIMMSYNVVRFFSKILVDGNSRINSVAGDGGTIAGAAIIANGFLNRQFYYNIMGNADIPITDTFFFGGGNYLNLSNHFEISPPSGYSGTVCNIEKKSDIIEKDENGYIVYSLFKPNTTRNIILAGTETEVSKTAHLMEFVYFHGVIPKCQHGQLYIEIEDFDVVGDISKDNFLYFYYWEGEKKASLEEALRDPEYQAGIDNDILLDTNNGNIPIKICNLSDLQGSGDEKKLIIWLTKYKEKGESYYFNLMIGLKPNDLRSDTLLGLVEDAYTGVPDIPTTEIKFKFKKAQIKLDKKIGLEINSIPLPYDYFGYIGIENVNSNFFGGVAQIVNMPIICLGSGGQAVYQFPDTAVSYFGLPNGGVVSGSYTSIINYAMYSSGSFQNKTISCSYADSLIYDYNALIFFRSRRTFYSNQTYRIKLPCFSDPARIKSNITSVYPFFSTEEPSEFKLKIYAGENLTTSGGQLYPNLKMWVDTFVLIAELSVEEYANEFITFKTTGYLETLPEWPDVPHVGDEEILFRKNRARWLEFSGDTIAHLSGDICFVAIIEKVGEDITNTTYAKTSDGETYAYPVGFNYDSNPNMSEGASVFGHAEYEIRAGPTEVYRNFDSMIYQPPQIIKKGEKPRQEKYFD